MKSKCKVSNVLKLGACALTVALLVTVGAAVASADDTERGIKVFLNGKELSYDVKPKIVSDRCMVPIGQTIEYLTNQTPEWNDSSKTMTFFANGNVVQHTVGTRTVYINGKESRDYGTASFIENGRTLIPLRMLSESAGCLLVWDDPSKTVILTTPDQNKDDEQDTTENVKMVSEEENKEENSEETHANPGSIDPKKNVEIVTVSTVKPEIILAVAEPKSMEPGSTSTITVTTNKATTRIKLLDLNNNEFVEVDKFTEEDGKHIFEVKWIITESGNFEAKIFAGNKITYENEYKVVSVSTDPDNPVDIIDVYTHTNDLREGREFYVTAVTNQAATRVSLTTSKEGEVVETRDFITDSEGNRVWQLAWTPHVQGYETLGVVADNDQRAVDMMSIRINIFAADIKPSIKDVHTDTKDVFAGNAALLTVKTNTAVNAVWYEWDGYVSEKNFEHYDSDGVRTWYLGVEPPGGSGTISAITVHAEDAAGEQVKQDIKVNIVGALITEDGLSVYGPGENRRKPPDTSRMLQANQTEEPVIYRTATISPTAKVGELVAVFVCTNGSADTVLLDDNTDPDDENGLNYFCSGISIGQNEKVFSFYVSVDKLKMPGINISAVGKEGSTARKTLDITVANPYKK